LPDNLAGQDRTCGQSVIRIPPRRRRDPASGYILDRPAAPALRLPRARIERQAG